MAFNYAKLSKADKRYWKECLCDNTLCAISKDGLLFLFLSNDISPILQKYPKKFNKYYFNYSFDREIAEELPINGYLHFIVNPQFVYQNFKEILC